MLGGGTETPEEGDGEEDDEEVEGDVDGACDDEVVLDGEAVAWLGEGPEFVDGCALKDTDPCAGEEEAGDGCHGHV